MLTNIKNNLKSVPFLYKVNSKLKSHLQESIDDTERKFYSGTVLKSQETFPDSKRIEELLKERLIRRGLIINKKNKGDLHILLIYPLNNWESVLPLSLKPFGVLSEFEIGKQGYNIKSSKWIRQRDKMNGDMLNYFYRINNSQKVDVIISYLSGYTCDPEILRKMSNSGAVIFNFWWDDKIGFKGDMIGGRWTGPAAIASAVDLNLTNAPGSVIKYFGEGGLAKFWPEAAHPLLHRPYDVPFEYEVSVLGGCYGWRPIFIDKLKKKGINIACFGNGWPNGAISDEESVKLFSRSRINLGFAGVGHSKKLMCLKGRDFEVPMSGGLYLTQDNPELSLVYNIGREILTYHNEEDCFEKIKWILENPATVDIIRKNGRERSLRDHTWEKRFKEIFILSGLMEDE